MSDHQYLDVIGRVLFVSDGISSSEWWGTFYRKKTGSLARFPSPALPMRSRREEAQADLDRYAALRRLKREEGAP